jgi:uncharacterized membrane protein (Fun14 family)
MNLAALIAEALATNTTTQANTTIGLIDLITSNPKVATAIGIQIVLGIALGYVMVKVLKYIIAFIGVLVVGAVLNVWSLGGSIEDFIANFGKQAEEAKDLIINLIKILGILSVGPLTLGFVLGILIGILKSK